MNKLKDYKIIKSPLLKEWDEQSFERIQKHIKSMLKTNFNHRIIIEHGFEEKTIDYINENYLEDVFGLPYTSSGDFAAIWNTNTQTVTKFGERLLFRGVAISESHQVVILFENKKEEFFYFYDYEFWQYQEDERIKTKAKEWGDFVKNANIIKNQALKVLKNYYSKPYGEKTADKIRQELKDFANNFNCQAWIDSSKYGQGLEISKNGMRQKFYFDFLNDENKIKEPTTHNGGEVKDIEEVDSLKEFIEAEKMIEKMQKTAKELLEQVEKFKNHSYKANFYPKETQSTYSINLESIAKGHITWEG